MIPLDESIDIYFNYKPYAEIIYYKRSLEEIRDFLKQCKENNGQPISVKEERAIELLANLFLDMNTSKNIISDFKSDTRGQLDAINEQIKEIKIKRLYA